MDAQRGRARIRIFVAGLTIAAMAVSIFAVPAAQAANPSGAKLQWLPYDAPKKEKKQSTPQVVTAYRSEAVESQPSSGAVHQAQALAPAADPFNDPFGDAQAAPAAIPEAPTLRPDPISRPGQFHTAVQAPDALPADPPAAMPAPKKPEAKLPGRSLSNFPENEKKIDFECRSLNDLGSIGQLNNDIAVPKDLQEYKVRIDKLGCPLGQGELPDRITHGWAPTTFTWQASALCHKPLYFEQAHVERYGHSTGPLTQPFVSGGLFFVTVPLLPYEMGLRPPFECLYSLGYYRPGSCAPYYIDPLPLSIRAGLIQAGAVVGAAAIIP